MKKRLVYVVYSRKENSSLIFCTRKRATEWIYSHFNPQVFEKSKPIDLYVQSRVVF